MNTHVENLKNENQPLAVSLLLPIELKRKQSNSNSDTDAPFFDKGKYTSARYYRYRDTPNGHEHFETGM